MSHIYQPVMLRTILDGGGAATRRQIAAAISAADLSQLEYYEKVVSRYPGPVLRRRGIVEYADGVYRLARQLGRFDEWERANLRALCEARVADFVAERRDRIWAHRSDNRDPVPGSLRWQVISRALGRCEGCGVSSAERALEVDHIEPRSRGGSNDLSNLQALCSLCNVQKLDREAVDFGAARVAAAARREGCYVCEAKPHDGLQNELAHVIADADGLVVAPKRHGATYIQLWQSEVNALRELELALSTRGFDWTGMTGAMRFAVGTDAGHLTISALKVGAL
ncbi:HNH endonuclease [Sphingomonas sp. TWP1-3-1]|uniref:HNH endonuclease n=1 Tax=Sphingomonas sp. TWP1-3-1 TaxID=2804612 RepID=UPI003CF6651A